MNSFCRAALGIFAVVSLAVPAGAPRWVTPELLADTLRVWQPYYGNLTSPDALSIITNVGNLFDVLRSSKP